MSRILFPPKLIVCLIALTVLLAAPHPVMAKGSAPQEAEQAKSVPPVKGAAERLEPPKRIRLTMDLKTGTSGGRGIFQFSFNQDMLDPQDQDKLGKAIAAEDFPFTFTPALEGEGKWQDRRSLVFTTYNQLPRATRISVKPKPSLASLSGEKADPDRLWNWNPYPLRFSANQIRYQENGTVTLEMSFSSPVNYAKLKSSLAVYDHDGSQLQLQIEPLKDEPSGQRVRVFVKPKVLEYVTVELPEGFTAEAGPTGLVKRDTTKKVNVTSMLAIETVRARQSSSPPWTRYIEIQTTNSADVDKIRQYLSITPATNVDIEARSSGFRINGDFVTRPRMTLTFKKGLPGLTGLLTEDFVSTVVFDDFSPRMAFDTEGTILSPNRAMRIPVSAMNVEKVQATLWQLPESNIPMMTMGFFNGYKKHLSRKIAVRTGPLNGVRNKQIDASIDLAQIAGQAKGVFLLTVDDASDPKKTRPDEPRGSGRHDDYDDYDYDDYRGDGVARSIEKLVVISDIGITARVMPTGLTVWANSVATTKSLENARVRVFAANNVLLAEGRTNKDGLWRHSRQEPWSGRERPALILVSTTADQGKKVPAEPGMAEASVTDMAFLKLESDLASDSAFDTGGRAYLNEGYEAFCFTPRGVFRPGETVDFKVLVRDALMHAPDRFPVAWRVRSSAGRTVGSGTAMLSAEGGAAFSLPLVPSAPTGTYTLSVSLPGQARKLLGSCTFAVEDFQPPRIEVNLKAEKPYFVGRDAVTIDIDAKYLFGAPAADAPWESEVTVKAGYFRHADWRTYIFPGRARQQPRQDNKGELDDKGHGSLTITPDSRWTAQVHTVTALIRVREDGGRWVARTVSVPYYPLDVLLGYEPSRDEAQAGVPYSMRVAAVTPDGKPAALKQVKATITRSESYYVRSDRGYTHAVRQAPVDEMTVTLENGVGVVTFTPPQRGTYQVLLDGGEGTADLTASVSVWSGVAGTDDGASPLVDRVMLSWERPRYQIGETAVLKVRSPFPGKLMVVLEGQRETLTMVLPLEGTETSVSLPVEASLLPNAYCSAWVIRPVEEGETWGAHRAFGIVPLLIDRSSAKLNVALETPDKILPKTDIPVSITVTDVNGRPVRGEVALALVDEGILSLTNFQTPDPFAFFTAKRAMQGRVFDIYDDLMPLSSRSPILLTAGGGAAGDDDSLTSPMTRKLEVLSIFLGTVNTDGNGQATTTLSLPEYSGRGRLMAVAASRNALGHGSSNVPIARDVTVEATVPRMVAPGDVFDVPLLAFGDGKKSIRATVEVLADGPLGVQGKSTFQVSLGPDKARESLPLSVKALDMSGLAALRIVTRIEGSSDKPFEQRLEIPVRPPYPRLTKSGNGVIRGGDKATIDVGGGFYPGTQRINLSFADSPGISLMRALDYLGSYPYGCLEQTTSAAWPYLAVPAMLKSIDPEKAQDTEYKKALDFAIRRIVAMQRTDGGFNGWPGMRISSAYAWQTIYATHFLSEAKGTGLVPQDALQSALGWMRVYLASSLPNTRHGITDALSVKAYICYVLALNGDAPLGWMQFIKDQGDYLSQSARIFLAGAYALASGKPDALRELGTLPLKPSAYYGWSLESAPRNEALRLLMWANVDPFAPETAALAKRVIDDGNANRWRNTQENAMAVMAIGRYMEKTAGASRDFQATLGAVTDGGALREIASFSHKDSPTFSAQALFPANSAPSPLLASVSGPGTAYYTWTTSGVPVEAPAPFAEGIFVLRRWVLEDGTVYDFAVDADGQLPEALRNLRIRQGARITVTLYVKPTAAMNSLVLADVVPGGFEIDNPNLVPDSEFAARSGTFINPATGKAFPRPTGYKDAREMNTYSHVRTEMRDDRLLLFADYLSGQAQSFTYTLRAVSKGDFVLPPVSAEDMYDPTIRALSPTARVVVE